MAKNTLRQNPVPRKDNEERKDEKKEERKKVTKAPSGRFRFDRRFQLTFGFLGLFASIFLTIAFISYLFTGKADQSIVEGLFDASVRESGQAVENWLGLLGSVVSHFFIFKWFGIASFLFVPILFLGGYKIVFRRELFPVGSLTRFCLFAALWISFLLGYLVLSSETAETLGFLGGGIGYEAAVWSHSLVGWGTLLLIAFSLIVFIIYFFDVTTIRGFNTRINTAMQEIELARQEEITIAPPPVAPPIPHVLEEVDIAPFANAAQANPFVEEEAVELAAQPAARKHNAVNGLNGMNGVNGVGTKPPKGGEIEFSIEPRYDDEDLPEPPPAAASPVVPVVPVYPKEKEASFPLADLPDYDPTMDLPQFQYPTLELMSEYQVTKAQVSVEELQANKDKIVETLGHYGIGIASIKATIGPTVTLYEIIPEAGVRISKIKSLEDDIALNLAALGIRIIAPIPGKGTIGIEVPNKNREMVSMRSVLASPAFQNNDRDLPIVLGKTISNEVYVTDLAKMPHLLMAGATGQGKSVGLNVILTSLIYKKHPSQLKFILVDPKKVELTLFNKIERHFLAMLPGGEDAIITDTKKVVHTLNSLCIEMDTRYELLKEANVRQIREYNQKFVGRRLNPEKGHRYLPYIVLVIDELADLMMTAGKEVELPIARLAQLARATGIHLVVATQRPSVNVITGLIKANFPARLSFRVTSKIDSRTILDEGGAEQLVGQGDMLLKMGSDMTRLQCAFVDTPEVERICDFIGSQRGYSSAYQLPEFEGDEAGEDKEEFDPKNRDPLFEEAARVIVTHQQGSTSLLQRRMKLGYNRAGRLIDQLESAGIVGPFEGSKAREVLIPDEQSLEQLLKKIGE
jgi:S-DNA-T family DNA segregation ATPase FtsK/SpoIIIE